MRAIEQLVAEGRAKLKRRRRDRYAPDLAEFVERAIVGGPGPRPTRIAAEEQLRGLLAVVRAAETHSHADVPPDPVDERRRCRICRALDRLKNPPRGEF